MTVLQRTSYRCALCECEFNAETVVSTNTFGGKRTDFQTRAAGVQPLPYLVQTCPSCGFTAPGERFEDYAKLDIIERNNLLSVVTPLYEKLSGGTSRLTGSEKYELAATIASELLEAPRVQAEHWLRAAWCAVDEGDIEAERFYRLHAVRLYQVALASFGEVPTEERAVITYLVGELWRRIGDLKKAADWFALVAEEVVDRSTQQWIIDAARQQRDCPREWFG